VQVEVLAVEEEPAVGGELEPSDAERGRLQIAHLVVDNDRNGQRVAVRMVGMPQEGMIDGSCEVDHLGRAGGNRAADVRERRDRAAGVGDDGHDGDLDRTGLVVDDLDRGVHLGPPGVDDRGGHADAVPVDTDRVGDDQADVAVDAAGEAVVPGPRCQARVPVVVHTDEDVVRTGDHRIGDVDDERRVAALVAPDQAAIDEHLGDLEHAEELQRHPLARPRLGHLEAPAVAAMADVEPGLAEVRQVERVRQTDVVPLGVGGFELSTGVLTVVERPVVIDEALLADHGGRDLSAVGCGRRAAHAWTARLR
jgi:hypothetical protein